MTGTSIDGIDVALVEIDGSGLGMSAELRDSFSLSLGDLQQPLRSLASGKKMSAAEITKLAYDFSLLHCEVLRQLTNGREIDLIAVHGQTVFHQPPWSWQLINPHNIAAKMGTAVVFDLRGADLSHGGQGAPITPLADYIVYRSDSENRAIVNLGGFCNYTILPYSGNISEISGGDVCVCNQLLDKVCREMTDMVFDKNGLLASSGNTEQKLAETLMNELIKQAKSGRSLGSGDELIETVAQDSSGLQPADILRTICHAISGVISNVVGDADRIILAGGGCYNRTLVKEIETACAAPVSLSSEFGIPVEYREAMAMAVLGALAQDRVPITLTQITGATAPSLAGSWIYP